MQKLKMVTILILLVSVYSVEAKGEDYWNDLKGCFETITYDEVDFKGDGRFGMVVEKKSDFLLDQNLKELDVLSIRLIRPDIVDGNKNKIPAMLIFEAVKSYLPQSWSYTHTGSYKYKYGNNHTVNVQQSLYVTPITGYNEPRFKIEFSGQATGQNITQSDSGKLEIKKVDCVPFVKPWHKK